jgi:hypothetical protein
LRRLDQFASTNMRHEFRKDAGPAFAMTTSDG